MEQRSAEWLAKRAGCFTASRMSDLMARTKSGPAASRKNMITTLAIERLTGQCVETFQNAAMLRGIELEQEALDAYSFEYGVAVETIAYLDHPNLPRVGCSPDGLVGDDGLVEVKCPASMAKHFDALRDGTHAHEYRWQAQHQMLVTGREWVDMVSYHPEFPVGLQLTAKRVFKDAEAHAEMVEEIARADDEIESMVSIMRELGGCNENATRRTA